METIKLKKLNAEILLTTEKGEVYSEFVLENTSSQPRPAHLRASQLGEIKLRQRKIGIQKLRPDFRQIAPVQLREYHEVLLEALFDAREQKVMDVDFVAPVEGGKTKSFMFRPELSLDDQLLMQRAEEYNVTVTLPSNAKRLVTSSIPVAQTRKTEKGIICLFKQANSMPIPLTLKWTEMEEDILISRAVVTGRNNILKITLSVKNRGDKIAKGLVLEDRFFGGDITPLKRELFVLESPNDKDTWWVFRQKFDLEAQKTVKFVFEIKSNTDNLSLRPAKVLKSGELLGVTEYYNKLFPFPPPPSMPNAAFVLPSGWSFDFKSEDHHINEHGMWCEGQIYDSPRERLNWSTGCVFADHNFDDDYKWQTAHQVIRFKPGFAVHRSSPWLAKSGNVTTVNEEFTHESLKLFSNAVVLITGWHFDFTSDDHHINRMQMQIDTPVFNKAQGKVNWQTKVTYIDKNFDDMYRFRYWYTVLGFNGAKATAEFSGSDSGGTAVHMGEVSSNSLKGYARALVIPIAWDFDYKHDDHHINEHHFKIQNVSYNPTTGKVSWSAHLNYSDKNFDDDYNWRYKVLVIGTNDGQSAEFVQGPYSDSGGYDVKNYIVELNRILKPITWTNGIKDGDETGIDCGGSSPAKCMDCLKNSINPGNASNAGYFSLKPPEVSVVRAFAQLALFEYAQYKGQPFATFYAGPEKVDRYVEAVAHYVNEHMDYASDGGAWNGPQRAFKTLVYSGYRGSKDFAGDCEDHAILRAALLRALGMDFHCIFCADHHNSVDQGQKTECGGPKKNSGGHAYNIVIYKGKYRILDYGPMQNRYWKGQECWDQHATDNIWNDHTGEHWNKKDVSPFGDQPLVNYPGNPSSPSANWDWRTYYNDITA